MIVSRFFLVTLAWVSCLASVSRASDDPVAIQYHFAGTASFTGNSNFAFAQQLCNLPSSFEFRRLTLDRLAGVFARNLQIKSNAGAAASLRPLLDDLLTVESVASFGGTGKDRLDFVLAAHLDAGRAQAWQKTFMAALGGAGEPFQTEGVSGTRWNRAGGDSLWLLQSRDWTVAGRGQDLPSVIADYLQQIQKNGRPCPPLKGAWVRAEVDWPHLATWAPLASSFKLARTAFQVTTASGGKFRVTGKISYAEALPWSGAPWRFPKDLVHEPLMSFTAARDLTPFFKPDAAVARIFASAFDNQFCCWSMREFAFQTYAAWPVADSHSALNKLRQTFLPDLNSLLTQPKGPKIAWSPSAGEIIWPKSGLMAPAISATRQKEGDYLVAKFFPLADSKKAAPAALWKQFEGNDDLVYYDWEFTGPRLQQWRLLSELLPVLPAAPAPSIQKGLAPPFVIVDGFLGGLTPYLGNTATEIKRSAPNEFTFTRTAPFVFSSFEILWLSHWLTETPAGPVNTNLLPMAKMTGPGMPRR